MVLLTKDDIIPVVLVKRFSPTSWTFFKEAAAAATNFTRFLCALLTLSQCQLLGSVHMESHSEQKCQRIKMLVYT